ncbi:uncharacterized protein Nab2 isoform X1 [Panulirus ornatus]|uniref:uncharacterized protein Nab2 isoform X1 n=1 Tax=Panulirus ornatus TaxID=150431 RepID=UPI003A83B076
MTSASYHLLKNSNIMDHTQQLMAPLSSLPTSAIKAKLVELGTYVDEELPDYIMVLVANKKTKDQMDDDLSLFLGHNTERFTSWLHHVLQKLNAAALLQVAAPQQEESKKKDIEEEKKKEREEEKKKERDEEKKREKAEEMKRFRDEEKRKVKEREKAERKRKSSERKVERKEKKLKKSDSPDSQDKSTKEKKVVESVKLVRSRDTVKEKEKESKEKNKTSLREDPSSTEKTSVVTLSQSDTASEKDSRKMKPQIRGKVSSADIFRAEAAGSGEQKRDEEEEDIVEDMLVLRADIDELGLELEEEPAPKKSKVELRQKVVAPKLDAQEEVKIETKIDQKVELRQKGKSKPEPVVTRLSAKERLGTLIPTKSDQPREKLSVLDRLGSTTSGGRRVINLREESSFPPRIESSGGTSTGMARAVSSAISSAHRSVCVLPSSSSSPGKKLEARVRPLMSRQVESNHDGLNQEASTREGIQSREESAREGSSRSVTGRVVSAVGAVLKRPHNQVDSDEEEYDPKKPQLSGMASKVEVTPRPRRPGAIQANTALILRAMADAHKSVNRPSRRSGEKPETSQKKQKSELFTRSYREREQTRQKELPSQEEVSSQEEVRIRKIAITVPNATRKESEKQLQEEKMEEEVLARVEITSTTSDDKEKDDVIENVVSQEEEYGPVPDSGFGVEEIEEVEEEVIDEGIEDQPLLPTSPQPRVHAVPGVENTKFIVTLEGVDTEIFPVKGEQLDIRSRLGVRPVHSDNLEEVEEYIEEVEEWEEEEETGSEMSRTSTVPAVGLIAGAEPHLKSAVSVMSAPQAGGSKERCKYWPLCKAGEACPYHHPTVTCKSFPACKYGDKCLFIHPNCLFDGACTRIGCPYTHASSRNLALASGKLKAKRICVFEKSRHYQKQFSK